VQWHWMPDALVASVNAEIEDPARKPSETAFALVESYHETLASHMARHTYIEVECLMLLVQLISAVAGLEKLKIYHRAIRPGAVFLTSAGNAYLAGFEDAIREWDVTIRPVLQNPIDEIRHADELCAAPEVFFLRDGEIFDWARADVFSVGCIGYKALGRPHAFVPGNRPTRNEIECVLARHKSRPCRVNVSRQLASVFRCLLRINPEERTTPQQALAICHAVLWNSYHSTSIPNLFEIEDVKGAETWLLELRNLHHVTLTKRQLESEGGNELKDMDRLLNAFLELRRSEIMGRRAQTQTHGAGGDRR